MGKLSTARRVLKTHGVRGIVSVLKDKFLNNNWLGGRLNWCYGKVIEIRGNVVRMEGCTFSLDSPVITTESKSKFMFDQYEWPEREAVRRFIDPNLPVVEFGGSVGVVSCLTNRKLHNPEKHVVVEANPALVPLLLKNRDQNQCKFTVLSRMVGYGGDHGSFYANSSNFVVSSAIPSETSGAVDVLDIPTTDLRSILDQNHFDRCTLICDIEGGESDLLRYESDVLKERVATLILEVHEWSLGKERVEELFKELAALGFQTVFSEIDTYTFQNKGDGVREFETTTIGC